MCSADANGDGQTELYQCQAVYQCPLGDYPCDENNQCSVQGSCTETAQWITQTWTPPLGPFGHPISTYGDFSDPDWLCQYLTGKSDAVAVSYTCASSGDICEYRHNGVWHVGSCYGENWCTTTGVGSITCKYQATAYICSLNGQTYFNLNDCQNACVETAACTQTWQCPIEHGTECEDVSISENYKDETPDLSYYQNDGAVDPNTGQCLGQIYFFNGRPMMCRHAGLQTGFHNCCDADDEVVQELADQLSLLGGTLAVISKLKDAISLASKAVELYTTAANQAAALGTSIETILNDVAINLNTPTVVYNGVLDAVKTGGSAADGALNSIVNGLSISPTSIVTNIALNFALNFAMNIFFGGCSEDDIITAAYNELGLCHFIGVKCVKKLPIIGCVQNASVYCCFNSKLARIIQEQGRPQLKTFYGWGTTDYPNCRGLTPQEFQNLDFAKINLYEWQQDIKTQSQNLIQQNLQQNFDNFVNNLK